MNKEQVQKLERLADIEVWERDKFKADLEFHRKPIWVQMQLEGDYHYNSFDMEPKEEE